MAQKESESSKGRKPRRRKRLQLLAHLEFPWCSHCSNLDGHMVTSYRGRQEEEGPSGPNTSHGGQQETCLPQPPLSRQTGPCSVSLLSRMAWVAVSGTRGGTSLLRAVPSSSSLPPHRDV